MGGRGAFGGWSAGTSDKGQWIQVDLGDITKVTRIATQNRYRYYRWVTEYKVSYSLDGGYFVFYHQPPENTTRVSLTDRAFSMQLNLGTPSQTIL